MADTPNLLKVSDKFLALLLVIPGPLESGGLFLVAEPMLHLLDVLLVLGVEHDLLDDLRRIVLRSSYSEDSGTTILLASGFIRKELEIGF